MANKTLFSSFRGLSVPKTNTLNQAGGHAYALDDKHALAQLATTGCLNGTYYASPVDQLETVLLLCDSVEPEFIAKTALYARQHAHMKDLPALLCAILSTKSPMLLAKTFDRVIDNPRMLRNFVQIMRSGVVGRKSLGSLPKRLVLKWLSSRSDEQLFLGSIGKDPSLADIIKMVHPKPSSKSREALFGFLIGREHNETEFPEVVQKYLAVKRGQSDSVPDVPFQFLTALPLGKQQWNQIARNARWQMTRMNLNTFARHGVFESREMTKIVAKRLRDPQLIKNSRVFPYQLMAAHRQLSAEVPQSINEALQDAMEVAIDNVPKIDGKVFVFPDISGSMHSAVTGYRRGSTSAVRCIDVAALIAAAIKRKNPDAEVVPFESRAITNFRMNARDSVITNAAKLAKLPAGGTNCSAPLRYLNEIKAKGELIVYVSDNESWVDSPNYGWMGGSATETMRLWSSFKQRNPSAKMMCIDIQPNKTTQAKERKDIVNVGGFSDQVFDLMAAVVRGNTDEGYWVRQIESTAL